MDFSISNLSNDDVISVYARSEKGVEYEIFFGQE